MEFKKAKVILGNSYYAVPDYQRDYEWTNTENSVLIDDIMESAKEENAHFVGAIVTIPFEKDTGNNKTIIFRDYDINEEDVKHIVDGQQRLTSLSILMKALIDCASEDSYASKDVQVSNNIQIINSCLRGTDMYNNKLAPKLILNGNTGHFFNDFIIENNTGNYNKVYRGVKHILAAYKLYHEQIQKRMIEFVNDGLCTNSAEYYIRLMKTVTHKITFVEIECDKSANAFQVFDSLNGKGLDLTAADRIKNIFMSWANIGKGAQLWQAISDTVGEEHLVGFFISLFFYHDEKRIGKNKLPDAFRNKYEKEAKNDFDKFNKQLLEDAKIYGDLRKCETGLDELDKEYLPDFVDLRMDQVFVILYATVKHYGKDVSLKGAKDDYIKFVKSLLILLVRIQVCDIGTNRLDSYFSECIKAMKNQNEDIKSLANRIKAHSDDISDDTFKNDFGNFTTADTKIARFYLRSLEMYLRIKDGQRGDVDRSLTVEHIIPQGLADLKDWYGDIEYDPSIELEFNKNYIIHIGNMLLLHGDDNSSASDNNYGLKKKVYINGKKNQKKGTPIKTFKLVVEQLKDYPEQFTHVEIEKRAKKLAEYALDIWK